MTVEWQRAVSRALEMSLRDLEVRGKVSYRNLTGWGAVRCCAIQRLFDEIVLERQVDAPSIGAQVMVSSKLLDVPYAQNVTKDYSYIVLPQLFLVRPEGINWERFGGRKDPSGYSIEELQQFCAYVQDKILLNCEQSSDLKLFRYEEGLRVFLRLLQKPDQFDRVIRFVLSHELGHVALRHTCDGSIKGCRQEERAADTFAAEDERARQGGIGLFRLLIDEQLASLNSVDPIRSIAKRLLYTEQGHYRWDPTHPNESERIYALVLAGG
jgi:hypothetical protein